MQETTVGFGIPRNWETSIILPIRETSTEIQIPKQPAGRTKKRGLLRHFNGMANTIDFEYSFNFWKVRYKKNPEAWICRIFNWKDSTFMLITPLGSSHWTLDERKWFRIICGIPSSALQVILSHFPLSSAQWMLPSARWDWWCSNYIWKQLIMYHLYIHNELFAYLITN